MKGYKNGHDYGPSWGDLCEQMEDFARANDKMVLYEIARTARTNGTDCLYFRLVAFTRWDGHRKVGERGEGHSWPANEWSTVPAMLCALLHRLDHRLAQEALAAEQQASF